MIWRSIEAEADFSKLTGLKSLEFDYGEPIDRLSFTAAFLEKETAKFGSAVIQHPLAATGIPGKVIFPLLDIPDLFTFIQGNCDNKWIMHGHSHLVVKANEILSKCDIVSYGGNETASVTIDFGSDSDALCQHNNTVTLETSGSETIITVSRRPGMFGQPIDFTVTVSERYRNFVIKTSNCDDTVIVKNTLPDAKTLSISTGGGKDTVRLGGVAGGMNGIYADVFVDGGEGDDLDELVIDDSQSTEPKAETLTSFFVQGVLLGANQTLRYEKFEIVTLKLTGGESTLDVSSTAPGSFTTISCGEKDDDIVVNTTQGGIEINCGG